MERPASSIDRILNMSFKEDTKFKPGDLVKISSNYWFRQPLQGKIGIIIDHVEDEWMSWDWKVMIEEKIVKVTQSEIVLI
jgi:hypothetical protein